MPRETIRRLACDLERHLVVGAHLAAADPGLVRDKAALDSLAAQLGGKAPAIARLAAAVGTTIVARGRSAARELVDLATMTAQVRAAQAQPAPAPVLAPLLPGPGIGSPCGAGELGELHAALIGPGKERLERLQRAIKRGAIADLRLTDALIHALGDGFVGDLVADQAVPRFGPALIPQVRARLDLAKGRALDGRRLRALVATDPAGSQELLLRALTEGSATVCEAALYAISDQAEGDPALEPTILDLAVKGRSGGVRWAALRALVAFASDASCAALIAALDDARTAEAASEGLVQSHHPKALDRVFERLSAAVAAAKEQEKARKKKPKKRTAKPPANAVDPAEMVTILLDALELADIALLRNGPAALPTCKAYEQARALCQQLGQVYDQARCTESLADLASARSDYDAARKAYDQARRLYKQIDEDFPMARCIEGLGDIADMRGDHATARRAYEQAQALYEEVEETDGQANCIYSLGDIALECGDLEAARAAYRQAQTLYAEVDQAYGQANCISSLGDIALAEGDLEMARTAYEQALTLFRDNDIARAEAACILRLANLALARRDLDGARAACEQARSIFARIGLLHGQADCIRSLGALALAHGDLDAARTGYEQALALFETYGIPSAQADCLLALGRISRTQHHAARATVQLEESLKLARRTTDTDVHAACLFLLAEPGSAEAERVTTLAQELRDLTTSQFHHFGVAADLVASLTAADPALRQEHRQRATSRLRAIPRFDLLLMLGLEGAADGAIGE